MWIFKERKSGLNYKCKIVKFKRNKLLDLLSSQPLSLPPTRNQKVQTEKLQMESVVCEKGLSLWLCAHQHCVFMFVSQLSEAAVA